MQPALFASASLELWPKICPWAESRDSAGTMASAIVNRKTTPAAEMIFDAVDAFISPWAGQG
jgi:hypothetical protein